MTREEAIKAFCGLSDVLLPRKYYREAIQMAISALKQPEIILCKDCKYRGIGDYCVYGTRLAWVTKSNDSCSKAERREE